MVKEGQIKISNEFKEFLRGQKQNTEDFEATIKRLISVPKDSTLEEKQSKNKYTKEIITPEIESVEGKIHKNMSDFHSEVQEKGLQDAPITVKEIKPNTNVKQLPYKLPINKQ